MVMTPKRRGLALVAILSGAVLYFAPAANGWQYEGQWNVGGSLAQPIGLAVAPVTGYVYVGLSGLRRVQYYTATGVYLGQWGSYGEGDGQFHTVDHITFNTATGNIYVVDDGSNARIQYFTPDGSFLGKWGSYGSGDGQFINNYGIAYSPVNGYIYVSEYAVPGYGNDRVQYFTSAGSFLGKWGRPGKGNGEFAYAMDVAVSPLTGHVYVTELMNDRVQYFTASGSFLGKWGTYGSGDGQFIWPNGITFSPGGGTVFVADGAGARVQYFTPSGSFLGAWGSYGTGDGQFLHTDGIDINAAGTRVYVVDQTNVRVQYFNGTPAVTPASLGRVKAMYW